jgi:nitrite reductase/ring-hydroxylating ferredoxin subunit
VEISAAGEESMSVTNEDTGRTGRRAVLAGIGAAGAVATLAACGASDGSGGAPTDGTTTTGAAAPTGAGATTGSGDGGAIKTGDIPVGGGKIYADQNVVVTQPTAGQFKAFSSTCSHAGCTVSSVGNGIIQCPCHGSQFSIKDGAATAGPAKEADTGPLSPKKVSVSGDTITIS